MDFQRLQLFVVTPEPESVADVSRLLMNLRVGVDLHHAADEHDAVRFLRAEGDFAGLAQPDLMLVDLDLGPEPVRGILEAVAAEAGLARLAVVALAQDPEEAVGELGAFRIHEVLSKPPVDEEFVRLLSYFDEV